MKKLFSLTLVLSVLMLSQLVFAQDFDFDNFNPEDFSDINDTSTEGIGIGQALALFGAMAGTMILIVLLPFIAIYVYFALTLSTIAKKTNTDNAWFAWLPILNIILMWKISGMPWWTLLLMLVPIANVVIMVIWWMKIAEKRGKPNWWGILMIVPLVGFVILGILAWSKGGENKPENVKESTQSKSQTTQKDAMLTLQDQEKLNKMIPYIKENLAQGYDANTIKSSLLQQGFDQNLVEKAIQMSQG